VSHGFSSYHRRRASPHAQCGAVGGQDGGRSPGQDDPAGEDERDERTGQSLTEASRHASVNVVGTTQMLDALVRHEIRPDKIVLASSRAVYGEGQWVDAEGRITYPGQRTHAMLETGQWDFAGLTPSVQSSTAVNASPANVYAATKFCQENLVTSWCGSFGVTPVLFRLQNVYGPGQSLINPYTGIVSLFPPPSPRPSAPARA